MTTEALAAQIGVPVERLEPFTGYSDTELQTLQTAVSRAVEEESKAFDEGLEHALRFVPALLRGAAKMLLFPGGRK
ncbi:MAG: hypothetical protein ACSLEW_10795 [Nocardioides sp.]